MNFDTDAQLMTDLSALELEAIDGGNVPWWAAVGTGLLTAGGCVLTGGYAFGLAGVAGCTLFGAVVAVGLEI